MCVAMAEGEEVKRMCRLEYASLFQSVEVGCMVSQISRLTVCMSVVDEDTDWRKHERDAPVPT